MAVFIQKSQGIAIVLALIFCGSLFGCASEPTSSPGWHVQDTHRWTPLSVSEGSGAGFTRLDSSTTGVGFVNRLREETYLENRHLVNGSGVALGDVNGDGHPDLYLARLEGPNALYFNRGGLTFEKIPGAGGASMGDEYSTGVVLTDVTGNRRADLLVTTLGGPNLMYANDGDGSFAEPETLRTGEGSKTMALADINGDGALDLYVTNYKYKTVLDVMPPEERRFNDVVVREDGEYRVREKFQEYYAVERQVTRVRRYEPAEPDRVYFNDGTGTFDEQDWTDVFRDADGTRPAERPRDWGLVVRLEDLDGDGTPDLYVCNDFASPDYYYLGRSDTGGFRKASPEALRTTSHSSMSIATTDAIRNGDKDFFVADMLGDTYERRQRQSGVRTPLQRKVGASTRRMQEMRNTFQRNRGDDTFAETASLAGVDASGWTWATSFVDVNLDGYEDLLAANGHAYDAMNADAQIRISNTGADQGPDWRRSLLMYPDLKLNNAAFKNQGDGTFEKMEDGWGLGREADISHGMATADLNGDGDLDAVVNRLNAPVGIYENETTAPRVAVRLAGRAPNTDGVGAQVRVSTPEETMPAQSKSVIAGGEYLSDSGGTLSFAMGEADSVQIAVQWPTDEETRVDGRSGRLYEIRQPAADPGWEAEQDTVESQPTAAGLTPSAMLTSVTGFFRNEPPRPTEHPDSGADRAASRADTSRLFEEVSNRLSHSHAENRYPDFERQPLLPRKLSQQGPGIAWADLTGNGREDLLIGTGRGGEMAYYRNEGNGQFTRVRGNALDQTYERDLTGIVSIPTEGGATVLVGQSNYERLPDDPERPSRILVFDATAEGLSLEDELTFGTGAVGPLALADVNGNGHLDLFAGGRHVPGHYPASTSSKLYLNEGGRFRRAASRSRAFEDLGLVTGAVFADVDRDGATDLFLSSEWGPIRYFQNRNNGYFEERTQEMGLADYTGFWRGIDVGDFNGDGEVDVAAANWGWNSKYGSPPGAPKNAESPQLEHPLRLYYGDFTRDGSTEPIETHYHTGRDEYVPYWGFSKIGREMSYVRRRIQSFERYSQSSISEIVGERRFEQARQKEASTLSHMVFLSDGAGDDRRFEGRALPWWSQLSAGFSPSVADVDGDGAQDILMSQNFFATEVETPRQDGGRALWLDGDGTGEFTPVKGHESGLEVYGEQRAAALGDMDMDGRIDAVVSQNGTQTRLFHNVGAAPGLRVRLEGRDENLRGVGATVRLMYEDGTRGPSTVIRAGSSYWSQHSRTPVLGVGERSVAEVQVRWPDGTRSETPVDAGARSVTVTHPEWD